MNRSSSNNYYIYAKKADFAQISEKFNISPILARVIRNRDVITDKEIDMYLNGDADSFYDPFKMKDMDKAVSLLEDAINNKTKIRVVGDYDTDGVCGAYILKRIIGAANENVDVKIPDRVHDGYGINVDMVKEAKEDGVGLIITCDNGISSYEAVDEAKKRGIKIIISDHHEVPYPLVDADAIVNVKQKECRYPYKEICGAATAYKIAVALNSHMALKEEKLLDELLVFAGIATIADVVPLKDENRIFASEGIKRISRSDNIGLDTLIKLKEINKNELSSFHIGFIIAPCLNSAGRLKDASAALKLLEADDKSKAEKLAKDLSDLNEKRKAMTNSCVAQAEKTADKMLEKDPQTKVIVIYLKNTHESIAGIIAGRLKDEYSRPVLIITDSEKGLKGSGRSVDAYNMVEALREHSELFDKLGGHAKAAGFSLADGVSAEDIAKTLNEACNISVEDMKEKSWIDMELPFKYAGIELANELERIEPTGLGNAKPVFAARDLTASSPVVLGRNNNVLKMALIDAEGVKMDAVMFSSEEKTAAAFEDIKNTIKEGNKLSVVYSLKVNEFRGSVKPQIRIIDII